MLANLHPSPLFWSLPRRPVPSCTNSSTKRASFYVSFLLTVNAINTPTPTMPQPCSGKTRKLYPMLKKNFWRVSFIKFQHFRDARTYPRTVSRIQEPSTHFHHRNSTGCNIICKKSGALSHPPKQKSSRLENVWKPRKTVNISPSRLHLNMLWTYMRTLSKNFCRVFCTFAPQRSVRNLRLKKSWMSKRQLYQTRNF